MLLPNALQLIHTELLSINAKSILVGGYVRDALMDKVQSKDIDIEVYGTVDIELLKATLQRLAPVHEVGRSFGVLKITLDNYDFDISLPRKESKSGLGHKGFSVELASNLSFKEAASRRDFTMNAIGFDIQTKTFLDPYNGIGDIKNKTIRIVNEKSFMDDPLRVLRAVQFAARFGFEVERETLNLCSKMVAKGMLEELPKERIFEEIKKLLLKSTQPSIGFALLDSIGAQFPEISALHGVEQSPIFHPEGDAYIHTMMSLDSMAKVKIDDEKEKLILMLAVLCHDFGKPSTTTNIQGKIQSIDHENAGLLPTQIFLERLSEENGLYDEIAPLVKHHMKPTQFYQQKSKDGAIRRLSTAVNIDRLIQVAKADFFGRTTPEAIKGIYEAGIWLRERAQALKVLHDKPQPILQGRDLIKVGLTPGPNFKQILILAYEQQIEGLISNHEEAVEWLTNYLT